jgi:hypothetical protein
MYTNITYTNRAVMKGVSKILWDWVKQGEGQARIKKLPHTRLNGEAQPTVEAHDLEEATHKQQALEQQQQQQRDTAAREEIESKKRRAEEIDMIRQRALARRKK